MYKGTIIIVKITLLNSGFVFTNSIIRSVTNMYITFFAARCYA